MEVGGDDILETKPTSEEVRFGHYYDYEELTRVLKNLVSNYPAASRLRSIGKTPEGRDLWLVEITNFREGAAESKPAIWMDGNTHAGEVMGSMICLRTIHYLLKSLSSEPYVTKLLNDVVFYVVPRVDPDGAEFFLKTHYYALPGDNETGGGRWYPLSKEEWTRTQSGLYMEDVNGDGSIASMRIEDPNGDWRVSSKDPRIMVRRGPSEVNGPFYRIYPEGFLLNHEGGREIRMAAARWSMNLNRNYPDDWSKQEIDRGSGPYPLSEPETRAIVDFIVDHPNICLAITYHTHGGVALGYSEEAKLPKEDQRLFGILESIFVKETSYVADARSPKPKGNFANYLTLHRGIPCLIIEVWDMAGLAGIGSFVERGGFGFSYASMTEDQTLKVLEWSDRELKGKGFVPWTEFDHPQLGRVEIGGWKARFLWRNPPEEFIEREADRNALFPIRCAWLLPRVRIVNWETKKRGENIYEIKATVANLGALPTYVSKHAVNIGGVKPVEVRLELSEGAKLLGSQDISRIQLDGYLIRDIAEPKSERVVCGDKHRETLVWHVEAKGAHKVTIRVNSQRAGKDEVTFSIPH